MNANEVIAYMALRHLGVKRQVHASIGHFKSGGSPVCNSSLPRKPEVFMRLQRLAAADGIKPRMDLGARQPLFAVISSIALAAERNVFGDCQPVPFAGSLVTGVANCLFISIGKRHATFTQP